MRKVPRVPGILKMPCLRSFSTPSFPAFTGTVLVLLPAFSPKSPILAAFQLLPCLAKAAGQAKAQVH